MVNVKTSPMLRMWWSMSLCPSSELKNIYVEPRRWEKKVDSDAQDKKKTGTCVMQA